MASSAVLLTIVAVGAAASMAVRPESDFVPPMAAVHRPPPGPAQIEQAEAAPAARPRTATPMPPERFGLFGVDVASAISEACGEGATGYLLSPEDVVCELISYGRERLTEDASEIIPLLLGGEGPLLGGEAPALR